MKYEAFIE